MTLDEAIQRLKTILPEDKSDYNELGQAVALGVQALEKQQCLKVTIERWIDTKCKCGYVFSKHYGDGYYDIPIEKQTKFCPNCGQRLCWVDEDINDRGID